MPPCDHPNAAKHKGHRHYFGGSMDGTMQHLVYATPSDFPAQIGTWLRDGQRSQYVRDDAASEGTEVVYRFTGLTVAKGSSS